MGEQIANWLTSFFEGDKGKMIAIFIISMLPIVELRGALLVAALPVFGVNWYSAFIIAVIGNLLPIPFILIFIEAIFDFMKKHKMLEGFVLKLETRARTKGEKIKKLEFWSLMLFVGVPLPGTGGWTGALIASVLKMDKRKAFISIALGVLIAGVIMTLVSYGIIGNIKL